ncbi:MAG: hypothetical protein H0Z29_11995 [Candidatus Marinimicrobia bacterium]|nr:hypothetical protein [Candidatus Neomarinimicrobiota bacterium]
MKTTIIAKNFIYSYKNFSYRTRPILLTSLTLIYLVNTFIHWEFLNILVNSICLLCIIICFPFVKSSARIVTSILLLFGSILLILAGADLKFWMSSIGKNINLVTLLIIVPIFGLPLYYGGYYKVLDALACRYMNSGHRIYWIPALLAHFFGALMNIGAIPVVYQLIIRGKLSSAFRTVPIAILRGFSSAIYWSPNMISVAVVTHYLNIPWKKFAQIGIIFTLLSLLAGWLVNVYFFNKKTSKPKQETKDIQVNSKKLTELIIFCSIFLGIIIIIAIKTTIPILNAVPLIALVYPVIWLSFLGKGNLIYNAYRDYTKNTLPKFTSEVVIFLGVGFFAAGILASGSNDKISLFLYEFIGLNSYLLCFFISSSVIILAILGITPMVTVMAYSASLNPDLIGLSPQLLSLVLVGGWATGILVSPFTGITLIMSGLTEKTPFETARENWPYAAIMVLLLSAVPILQK